MKAYVIDAVAILAYLADNLPEDANKIFKKAENKEIKLLLPTIALGETLYTIYKGKEIFGKSISLDKVDLIFEILQNKEVIELVSLNLDAWRIFHGLTISELHDRMIVATYQHLKANGIVTNDPQISQYVTSIW